MDRKLENGDHVEKDQGTCRRERVLFVALPNCNPVARNPLATYPDAVAAVDVDPDSDTYCKILSLLEMPNEGDELHHFGTSADTNDGGPSASPSGSAPNRLIFPAQSSGRIYVVDARDPKELRLDKTIESDTLTSLGLSYPNKVLRIGDSLLLNTLGDNRLENSGNFVLLDRQTFEPLATWSKTTDEEEQEEDGPVGSAKFGGDFNVLSEHKVLLSTGWGNPAKFRHGLWPSDVAHGHYSNQVYAWDLEQRRLFQTITLEGETGWMPMRVQFVPSRAQSADGRCHAFVCTLLGSAIYHLWRDKDDSLFNHRLAAKIPPKKVEGWQCPSFLPQFIQDLLVFMNWALPKMPAFTSDLTISQDGRFLYVSNWLHGDVRQYDISDPFDIKMVGQCFIAGSIKKGSGVEVIEDEELNEQPEGLTWNDGTDLDGGPHMLRLSADGRRLYVTNSMYLPWDAQFYPELAKKGSTMAQLDVHDGGGLSVNKRFHVHFGQSSDLPKGPYAAREMHFAGGDDDALC